MAVNLQLRRLQPQDHNFVLDTWLRSHRQTPWGLSMLEAIYFRNHRRRVLAALERSTTVVSCDPEFEDQIFGYIVLEDHGEMACVHYMYLKDLYRGMGIGKQMMELIPQASYLFYSHQSRRRKDKRTKFSDHFEKTTGAIYNPYLFLSDQDGKLWREAFTVASFKRRQV